MANGWIKLHRKILDNQFLMHDTTAFIVFTKLLLLVDYETGEWAGGSFQLAKLLGYANYTTPYRAVIRLETQGMVQRLVQTKYTTIRICKWKDYQDERKLGRNGSRNTDAIQTQTSAQTLSRREEVKNKEIKPFLLKPTDYQESGSNPKFREWCGTDRKQTYLEWLVDNYA